MSMAKSNNDPRTDTTGDAGCIGTPFGDILWKTIPSGSTMHEWGNRKPAKHDHGKKIKDDPK